MTLDGEPIRLGPGRLAAGTDRRPAPAGQRRYRRRRMSSSTSARSRRGRNSATSTPSSWPTRRRPLPDVGGPEVSRRAVITGVGVVAPGGLGREAFWDQLTAGRTATRTISLFDPTGFRSRIAAEVRLRPARRRAQSHQEIRRMDRAAQFAVVVHPGGADRQRPAAGGLSTRPGSRSASAARSAARWAWRRSTRSSPTVGKHWLVDHRLRGAAPVRATWCRAPSRSRWPGWSAPRARWR